MPADSDRSVLLGGQIEAASAGRGRRHDEEHPEGCPVRRDRRLTSRRPCPLLDPPFPRGRADLTASLTFWAPASIFLPAFSAGPADSHPASGAPAINNRATRGAKTVLRFLTHRELSSKMPSGDRRPQGMRCRSAIRFLRSTASCKTSSRRYAGEDTFIMHQLSQKQFNRTVDVEAEPSMHLARAADSSIGCTNLIATVSGN